MSLLLYFNHFSLDCVLGLGLWSCPPNHPRCHIILPIRKFDVLQINLADKHKSRNDSILNYYPVYQNVPQSGETPTAEEASPPRGKTRKRAPEHHDIKLRAQLSQIVTRRQDVLAECDNGF